MRYVARIEIDTRDRPASIDDVEDEIYNALNEIAENEPGWAVDLIEGPEVTEVDP